ncbi:MAG TPA: hypothetical protein VKT72_00895 [Candidatus Baltobacteraceae bacterium]|nr:hypothetical protein [Candidatus Baltobacteraceae bacterium]
MRTHQTLRIVLYALSVIEGIAGVVLLFATGWVLSFAPQLLALSSTGFVVLLLKGIGIISLGLGYLACAAARDPVRYVAVIDATVFILIAAAAENFYAVVALHLGSLYPTPYLLVRGIIQLALALTLLAMRPKAAPTAQALRT